MDKKEIREECYKDMLETAIIATDSVLNQINKLKNQKDIIDTNIIEKDLIRVYFDLELALANMAIILRKMDENLFITINEDTRKDVNSIIHSNRFEYNDDNCLYVYSKRGKEEVFLDKLIDYAKSVLNH